MTLPDEAVTGNRLGRARLRRIGRENSQSVAHYLRLNGEVISDAGDVSKTVFTVTVRRDLPRLALACGGLPIAVEEEAFRRADQAADILYRLAFSSERLHARSDQAAQDD